MSEACKDQRQLDLFLYNHHYTFHGPNRNTKSQLTGGEARWDAELLLELLPDPELGYEGTGTGGAARGMWVSVHTAGPHYSSGDLTGTSTPVTSSQQITPTPTTPQPPRYTRP